MGKKQFRVFLAICVLLLMTSGSYATIRNRGVSKKADIDLGKINVEADPNEHRAASDGYNQFMQMPTVLNTNQITPASGFNGAIWYDADDDLLEAVIGGSKVNIGASASVETLDAAYTAGNTITADASGDVEIDLSVTARKVNIANTFAGTQAVALGIDAEAAQVITDAILFSCTAGTITDAVDAKHASITNALNVGANVIYGTGGASIDFDEFDVASGTGSVTINDIGDLGAFTVEGTVLDINSLDFVAAGVITTAAAGNAISIIPHNGDAAGEDLIITAHNLQITAGGAITISPDGTPATTLGIDATDTDLTNALSVGDNAILGTTGIIDYTNFDVDAAGGIVATSLDVGSGTITTTGNLDVGQVLESAIQPSSGNLAIDAATGANVIIIGANSTGGITVSDNVTFGVTSLFSGGNGLGFRAAAENISSSGSNQLDIDATTEVEITTASLDANLSAALLIDAVTASNITVTTGDLTIQASDSGNAGTYDVIIESGNAAPSAGEDGNDIALEAEDDLLFQATDDADFDVADFLVDATTTISLDAAAGASNFTTTGGDLTLESTDASVNINATEAAADQIKLNAQGIIAGNAIVVTTTRGGIYLDANHTDDGDLILNANDDLTLDATGLISLDAGAASNYTTSAGDLTLEASVASVNINANEAAADQIKLNAQGTIAGVAINLTTTDGGITIDANNSANGDIVIDAEATLDVNTTGAITVNTANVSGSAADITITGGNSTGAGGDGGDIILVAGDLDGGGTQGYIKFSDDALFATTEKIYFNDTGTFINSPSNGKIEIEADGGGADDILLDGGITVAAGHDLTMGTGHVIGAGNSEIDGFRLDLVAATATTITAAQSGNVFYNTGAVQIELPEASASLGCYYTFVVANAANFDINPDNADLILGLTNVAGDMIRSGVLGDSITLAATEDDEWHVIGSSNTNASADSWVDAD